MMSLISSAHPSIHLHADGAYRDGSLGPGEQEPREVRRLLVCASSVCLALWTRTFSLFLRHQSGPGERRTPPEAEPRMGGAPPPGPPLGPMDGPFPRRAPYGPPPPDYYPPRGPGVPPMMPSKQSGLHYTILSPDSIGCNLKPYLLLCLQCGPPHLQE